MKILLCLLAVCLAYSLNGEAALDKHIEEMCDRADYKEAIQELQKQLSSSPKSDLYLALATIYLKDQQEEQALASFAQALKTAKPVKKTPSSAELNLFKELLPIYLQQKEMIEERLTTVLKNHPDYLYVQFLSAAINANKRKFETFFTSFYRSYMAYPDCYMAYKSQGVLASLLLQRAREVEQKALWRKEALYYFRLACKEMPQDTGLYKMLICTAGPEEKKETVTFAIETIITTDTAIPRAEIPFYVQEALQIGNKDLAEKLVKKATSWYQYSRIIQEMQRQIDEYKE